MKSATKRTTTRTTRRVTNPTIGCAAMRAGLALAAMPASASGALASEGARAAALDTPLLFPALGASERFYLALFVATLVLHLAFAAYTLGGACFVLACAARGRYSPGAARDALAHAVRDWLPSAASGAITAGIAPLLFVQLVYQKAFYTANLLLFNRWMAILPVLIAAIYAMYLVKAKHRATSRAARTASALAVAALVGFVAAAFVENHLLSLAPGAWSAMYETGDSPVPAAAHAARLALFALAALPVFALLAGWQMRLGAAGADDADRARAARPLALVALGGTLGAAIASASYARISPEIAEAASSAAGRPFAIALAAGAAVAAAAWIRIAARAELSRDALAVASLGTLLAMLGGACVRETVRVAALAETGAAAHGPRAVAGFVAFSVFALLGIATILWIVRAVARDLRATRPAG